jgi:hypothetical protein
MRATGIPPHLAIATQISDLTVEVREMIIMSDRMMYLFLAIIL